MRIRGIRTIDAGSRPRELTFAEVLGKQGYATGLFGKWHLGYTKNFNPTHNGFDRFVGFVSGNIDYISHYDRMGTFDWWHDLDLHKEQGYSTHLINQHTLQFIEANKDRPFCVYVAHEAIHNPNQGPDDPPIRGPNRQPRSKLSPVNQAVKQMTLAMDDGVGEIIAKLRELNLDTKTLVLFFSDNGGTGENRSTGPKLRGQKGTVWEGGHRVPSIAWWPGKIEAGSTTDQLAMTVDVFPTLVELAGARLPDNHQLDGVSLASVLTARTVARTAPAFLGSRQRRRQKNLCHARRGLETGGRNQRHPTPLSPR